MNKEQLIKDNAKLEERLTEWRTVDTNRRELLSKILGNFHHGYGISSVDTLSWLEIAAKIGGLLQHRDTTNIIDKLEHIVPNGKTS